MTIPRCLHPLLLRETAAVIHYPETNSVKFSSEEQADDHSLRVCFDIVQSLLNNPVKDKASLRIRQAIEISGRFQLNGNLASLLERSNEVLQRFDQSLLKLRRRKIPDNLTDGGSLLSRISHALCKNAI